LSTANDRIMANGYREARWQQTGLRAVVARLDAGLDSALWREDPPKTRG